jgi:hypothetical protein
MREQGIRYVVISLPLLSEQSRVKCPLPDIELAQTSAMVINAHFTMCAISPLIR